MKDLKKVYGRAALGLTLLPTETASTEPSTKQKRKKRK